MKQSIRDDGRRVRLSLPLFGSGKEPLEDLFPAPHSLLVREFTDNVITREHPECDSARPDLTCNGRLSGALDPVDKDHMTPFADTFRGVLGLVFRGEVPIRRLLPSSSHRSSSLCVRRLEVFTSRGVSGIGGIG